MLQKKPEKLAVTTEVQRVFAMETIYHLIQLHWCKLAGFQNVAAGRLASSCKFQLLSLRIFDLNSLYLQYLL